MPEILVDKEHETATAGNIILLSTEVREIISQKANWIVRNGMVLFLIIICGLISATFFISYPDVVTTQAKFTSLNAPKEVTAKVEGRLVKPSVSEGQEVTQEEVIGFVESRAAHNEVISLAQIADNLQTVLESGNTQKLSAFSKISYKNLGEIQPAYQTFMQAFNTFQQYLVNGFYLKKMQMLEEDLTYMDKLHATLEDQKKMQEEDLSLAGKTFDANKSLSDDKVISAFDYRNEKSKYLGKAMNIPQINAAIITNENGRHEKQKEIAQLDNDVALQRGIFSQALNTIVAEILDWENKYLIKAPIAGKVAFTDRLQENVTLKQGQSICFINPENTSYYAGLVIPQNNFGKVKVGERVLLKLPAYPYQEFGVVTGSLDYISSIPSDSGFYAKVVLPAGMITNYKKKLFYREGLTAEAQIITDDMKLSDRLFNSLRNVFVR